MWSQVGLRSLLLLLLATLDSSLSRAHCGKAINL